MNLINPDGTLKLRGWITPLVARIAKWLVWFPRLILGARPDPTGRHDPLVTAHRAMKVDTFIAVMFLLCCACYLGANWAWEHGTNGGKVAFCIIPLIRISWIIGNIACVGLFDRFDTPAKSGPPPVASHERMIVLGFVNFIELTVCFGAFYAANRSLIGGRGELDWFDPLHLSAISQLTVGYGDVYPLRWLRMVAWFQGFATLSLLVLLVGRFVGLPKYELSQDEEQRMGRLSGAPSSPEQPKSISGGPPPPLE